MQRVFITGGAGFIGRWVVAECLRRRWKVTVYDNLCAGTLDNLEEFSAEIEFVRGDVLDQRLLESECARVRPEVVIHLAALHFIPYCNAHPEETLRVNAEGTFTVLKAAVAAGAERAVIASSGIVYPGVDSLLKEEVQVEPPDVYGLSKVLAENVAEYMGRTTLLACVSARLFNTYGPFETNPHLIPHIMEEVHKGTDIHLGNIHTKRDYIYVEDTARLLVECAEAATEAHTIVNVGTGEEYSAEEIVRVTGEIQNQPLRILSDPARVRSVDKLHQRADITTLRHLTGAEPRIHLREGLTRLLQFESLLPPVEAG